MKLFLLPTLILTFFFIPTNSLSAQNLGLTDSFGFGGVSVCGHLDDADSYREWLVQDDGKFILVGDSYKRGDNSWSIVMCRMNQNGVLDTSFGNEGTVIIKNGFRSIARGASLQADGKIVVVGSENTSNGFSSITAAVYRFNADGSFDTSFGSNGTKNMGFNGDLFNAHVKEDGTILVMGADYSTNTNKIFRLFENGDRDTTFSSDGATTRGPSAAANNYSYDAAVAPNGNIVTATYRIDNGSIKPIFTSTLANGEVDTTFNSSGTVTVDEVVLQGEPTPVAIDSDGNIYSGGTYNRPTSSGSMGTIAIWKYKPDGSRDSGFGDNGRLDISLEDENLYLKGITIAESGAIYILGRDWFGFGVGAIYKIDSSGALDTSFQSDGYFRADLNGNSGTHFVFDVLEDSNGALFVSGYDFASNAGDLVIARFEIMTNTSNEIPFEKSTLEVYPNPVSSEVNITQDLQGNFDSIQVFDSLGRIVMSGELTPQSRNTFSMDSLTKGTYFLRFSGSGQITTKKIVVR